MTLKERIKDFWFRLKIFVWYLLTEPIRQFIILFKLVGRILSVLNQTFTWVYISLGVVIYALFMGNRSAAAIFFIFFLIIVVFWEWQRGFFMHRYRQKTKQRIRNKLNETNEEGENNGKTR